MITKRQFLNFYLPAFSRAFETNWRMDRGVAVMLSVEPRSDLVSQVDDTARALAAREHSAVKKDHIRHAAHAVALGRDISSKDLDNRQLDRVVTLFRLLADPDDLAAMMAWQQPNRPDRKRLEWSVRHSGFPPGYIAALCRDKFGNSRWDALDDVRLRQLVITLKNRPKPTVTVSASVDENALF